jgi:protein-tyrosine phosphatase
MTIFMECRLMMRIFASESTWFPGATHAKRHRHRQMNPLLASRAAAGVCSGARMREILFICTGNYYRSRYCEALFNHEASRRGLGWRAFSRGLAIHLAPPGLSPFTARRLKERGIPRDATGEEPVQVQEADFLRAARVVALMEEEHRPMMARLHPAWENGIAYWKINDLDAAAAEVALAAIEERVLALIGELEQAE